MNFEDLMLETGQHGFIAGKNGSGKTELAHVLLRRPPFVIYYDAKGTIRWPGFERARTFKDFFRKAERAPKVIYAPDPGELRDPDLHEAFFRYAFDRARTNPNRTPLVVGLGETYALTQNDELPESMFAIATRGRELRVTLLCETQRPLNIPQELMSEAKRFYIFRLTMPQDRRKIASIIPVDEKRLGALGQYRFVYYRDEDNEPMPPAGDGLKLLLPARL